MPALGKRIPVPLIGPSSQARALGQNVERTINLYPEASRGNPKAPVALLHCPGRTLVGTEFTRSESVPVSGPADFSPARGMHVMAGALYLVEHNRLRKWRANDTVETLATLGTTSGRVVITDNAGKLVIGDGENFYVYDPVADTLTTVTDGSDPIRGLWSGYLNGQTLYLQADSQTIWYSDVGDPVTVDGLSFFQAEFSPDNANCLVVDRGEVYVGGERSIQVFYNSGAPDNPFEPVGGGVIPYGVSAPFSFEPFDGGLVFVGVSDEGRGRVLRMNGPGGQVERISTHAVEKAVGLVPDPSDITAFTYEEEGHLFYVLNLPGEEINDPGITWAFDAATGEWHERGVRAYADGLWHRDRAEIHAYAYGKHYVADYKRGEMFVQGLDILTNELHPTVAFRVFPIDTHGLVATLDRLEFDAAPGVGQDGDADDHEAAPKIMLRISEDGGRNWGNEILVDLGRIGAFDTKIEATRLGRSNNFAVEIDISAQVVRQLHRCWATLRG